MISKILSIGPFAWVIISIFANVSAGIFLRLTSRSTTHNAAEISKQFSIPPTETLIFLFFALSSYAIAFVGYAMALKNLRVSLAYVLITAATFMLLACYDVLFADAELSWQKIIAVPLIIGGLAFYSMGK